MKNALLLLLQSISIVMVMAGVTYGMVMLLQPDTDIMQYKELSENYVSVNESETPVITAQTTEITMQPENNKISVDFTNLLSLNEDLVGWIYVEGLSISYPVVQSDNSYYLQRSFMREISRYGAIFTDYEISYDDSDILIIYGHNMGGNSEEMFSALSGYDDIDFCNEHKEIITLDIHNNETVWTVFATVHADVSEQWTELYRRNRFADSADFDEYIKSITDNRLFETMQTPRYGNRILLLSTCLGGSDRDIRRLIFAFSG